MSSNYRKIKYQTEGPYASTDEEYLYIEYNATLDYTRFYNQFGDELFTCHEWGDFDMSDAIVIALTNFKNEKLENVSTDEIEKIFNKKHILDTTKESELIIKEYIRNGGKIFTIKSFSKIRDGGTISVLTSNDIEYFIHKDNNTIHTSYPPTDDNIISDELLISFIIDSVKTYIKRLEEKIFENKCILKNILKKNV
jgi:hypothetical protein